MSTATSRFELAVVTGLLAIHTCLLSWSAYCHSPVATEIGHLPAGISHWQFQRFDLYRVNPPLVRIAAALPVMFARPATNWSHYDLDPLVRSEADVGVDFAVANGKRTFFLFTLARWGCIPFSWIGACVCYRYSRMLFGRAAGLSALGLWCFCPNILGHGSLLMPDMPGAALGIAASYRFWRWLQRPTWPAAVAAGCMLGLAELTKTTLVIFYPLWALLWIAYRVVGLPIIARRLSREAGMLVAQWVISLYILNLGYGFEGTWQRLADYRFQSNVLKGPSMSTADSTASNRFAQSMFGRMPVPLPRNYVQGIDTQRLDLERGKVSFLAGRWNDCGWWYFYLYGLAIKIPLGAWILLVLATVIASVPRLRSVTWRDEMVLLAPAGALLLFVSSQTGFSIHFRYILPAFPFLFIWASRSFQRLDLRTMGRSLNWRQFYRTVAIGSFVYFVGSSLGQFPHSLSYFNELVGGPRNGHEHLLDSNIAWGQDLLYLKTWYDAHPEARPLYLAMFGLLNPQLAGIEFRLPPDALQTERDGKFLPSPGWYVIDVNHLHNSGHTVVDESGKLRRLELNDRIFRRFLGLQPEGIIGYSFYVYHIPDSPEIVIRQDVKE